MTDDMIFLIYEKVVEVVKAEDVVVRVCSLGVRKNLYLAHFQGSYSLNFLI